MSQKKENKGKTRKPKLGKRFESSEKKEEGPLVILCRQEKNSDHDKSRIGRCKKFGDNPFIRLKDCGS